MRDSYRKLIEARDGAEQERRTIAQNRGADRELAREAYEQYVSDELCPALSAALEDAHGDLDTSDIHELADALWARLETKGLLKTKSIEIEVDDGELPDELTVYWALKLHSRVDKLTVTQLRSLGKHYFNAEWLTSTKKKTIIIGLRKRLTAFLKENRR